MIESLIYDLIQSFGLVVVLVLFYLRGILIGKIIPITVVIPSYIIFADLSGIYIFLFTGVTAAAATAGNFSIYATFYRYNTDNMTDDFSYIEDNIPYITYIPYLDYTNFRIQMFNNYLNTYGYLVIFVTNCIPTLSATISIPAGLNNIKPIQFLSATYLSNFLMHTLVALLLTETIRYFITFF